MLIERDFLKNINDLIEYMDELAEDLSRVKYDIRALKPNLSEEDKLEIGATVEQITYSLCEIYRFGLKAIRMSIEYWKDFDSVEMTFMEHPKLNFEYFDGGDEFLEFKEHIEYKYTPQGLSSDLVPWFKVDGFTKKEKEKAENILADKVVTNWDCFNRMSDRHFDYDEPNELFSHFLTRFEHEKSKNR